MNAHNLDGGQAPESLSHGLRLLIVTQVVDIEHPILGFFVRWIEEFATHSEKITVVCLRKGKYSLPKHVEVIALGEHHRIRRTFELCSISFGRRTEYDAVFAHMSPEFVVAAGWLWRLLGKEIGHWYTHKSVTLWLRIAVIFAHHEFSASKDSFRYATSKLIIPGHGIDTEFFSQDSRVRREEHLLSVGRLMKSKRHDLAIEVAAQSGKKLRIAGDGPEEENLKRLAEKLGASVTFLGGLNQKQLRDEYRRAECLIHTSETGGLDKVVLEALACDIPVISTAAIFREFPVTLVEPTSEAIGKALASHASIDRVSMIRDKHSLSGTVSRIVSAYGK
jgi:glycosyltransferase involved in cell wall biosynthesis